MRMTVREDSDTIFYLMWLIEAELLNAHGGPAQWMDR